jgi:type I restriction-modification system DNA methylase subunit
MKQVSIPELVTRLIAKNDGNAEKAAQQLGTSVASLSRWKSGHSRPRRQLEERLCAISDGPGDLVAIAERGESDIRLERLEQAISTTLHALREEFHRTASVSTRQEVLDLVAVLFLAHVTSIDSGGRGIGEYLRAKKEEAVTALNRFVIDALKIHLPRRSEEVGGEGQLKIERFFSPLSKNDEEFVVSLFRIFERDANAFQDLHKAGRDDLINEVFSRFMSTSFVDEKEMGQYLTPVEIVRFMVETGFSALTPKVRAQLLDPHRDDETGVILDPSCGVGSFLAETIRVCHGVVRHERDVRTTSRWLHQFVANRVVGIDKSERMIRLAMINLGLFGATSANLTLANGLARIGQEGRLTAQLEGRAHLILTNPPFGATYSGADINSFLIGSKRKRAESEILFLERYIDWLAPGGVVVSIVPDSVLVNRGPFAQLRSLLRDRCSVEAVVSLPPVTFAAAGTSTKTSVLVMRKQDHTATPDNTFFGEAKEVGFDVVTRSGQRRRIRSPRNDLPTLLAEYRGECSLRRGRRHQLAKNAERWDAGFHIGLPDNFAAIVEDQRGAFIKVSEIATLIDERIDPRRRSEPEFNYIEISDVDTRAGLVGHKPTLAANAPSRARKLVRAGDVLVSTVRPERGSIGVVPAVLDGAICSTGFAVLRCFECHPLALVSLLKTELVRKQMVRNNIGIAYPAISEAACLELILPVNRIDIGTLSVAAEKLSRAQIKFEETRRAFLAQVNSLDRTNVELGQFPDILDASEPSPVTDVA